MDVNDNELLALETVHLFVELLESYFSNVCELDIVFNFNKVRLQSPPRSAVIKYTKYEVVGDGRARCGFLPSPGDGLCLSPPSGVDIASSPRPSLEACTHGARKSW